MSANKLHEISKAFAKLRNNPPLTFERLRTFHMMIGTMKIGIPIYDATKLEEFQFPFKNTEKPVMSVMSDVPTNPYQAVKGCRGDFHGKVSRLTP